MAKILFIDDDTNTLSLMEKIAQILGHQAVTCPQASQAVNFVKTEGPDMVMVDVNMQELNGFDVVKQIRSNLPKNNLPILIVSASDPNIEQKLALNSGANGFIPKPLTIDGLSKAIDKFNHNHHQ